MPRFYIAIPVTPPFIIAYAPPGTPSTAGTAKKNRNLCLADAANPAHPRKSPIDDNAHLSSYDYILILSANADI